jgi:hypothetical protein
VGLMADFFIFYIRHPARCHCMASQREAFLFEALIFFADILNTVPQYTRMLLLLYFAAPI